MINIFGSFAYKVSSVLLFIGGTILLAGSAGLGFALSKDLFKKKWEHFKDISDTTLHLRK